MFKPMLKTAFLSLGLIFATSNSTLAEIPLQKAVQGQLDSAKKLDQADANNKALVQTLEDTLSLLSQIEKQKADNEALNKSIQDAQKALTASQNNLEKLKAIVIPSAETLTQKSTTNLQKELTAAQAKLETVQHDLSLINNNLVTQNTAPDKAQASLTEMVKRKQEINAQLSAANIQSELQAKLEAELELIELKNTYNQTLLNGSENLAAVYSSQLEEKRQEQQNLQTEIANLQTAINNQIVEESKNKLEQAQAVQNQQNNATANPIILRELDLNTKITQELLEQTKDMTQLSQDNLRIKSVLDNLQQTQRNIEEQISSLQGTLVLSRIINKQKQSLPQDEIISGIPKQITDLRVRVFDITELRDSFANINTYIDKLEKDGKTTFTAQEKSQLTTILQERSATLSEMLKSLNSQLNLLINIELNQQQVQTISDTLQQKLQQQSFWVKSNSPMDLEWFSKFIDIAHYQILDIGKKLNFSNWRDNIVPAGILVTILLSLAAFINRQKDKIKQKLHHINNRLKIVATDSQWNTPLAIFWSLVLCLPSTFIFLAGFIAITYISFENPQEVWAWGLKMAIYWLYFAFLVAMLRPHGIGHIHFNMPQKSNEIFRNILRRSVWLIALLLNTSIFTKLETGVSYDVLGQTMTILVLILMIWMIAPAFRQAISTYENVTHQETKESKSIPLTIVKLVLLIAPIVLIVLIVLGYYYTALVIIEHLIASYFAIITWIIVRNVLYRAFSISARRLAYRRLQEKREAAEAKARAKAEQNNENPDGVEIPFELKEDSIAVSEVKNQMLKLTDFVLWIVLFVLLYWVWSDLITVALYLDGVTLWQQSVTTEAGIVMESITLLNLLTAILIIVVMVVLIRNLSGLLEALIFSHFKLSQGTPYTITTLLTYLIIALGAIFAFGTLGVSWSKLQWLLTALSVGLGFGMQEIFANFVSGIIILFERPMRIGDTITIGTYSGTVSKIRIRATTLVDFDGKEVIVPNKAFVTERLVNWALSSTATRIIVQVGVAYGSDVELVKRLLLQVAEENPKVLKDPQPRAYFLTFGASTLDHELRAYVNDLSDRNPTIDALNTRIHQLFNEHNIDIAFNQLDVYIKNNDTQDEIKIGSKRFDFELPNNITTKEKE
ncbi:Potassium efflux system protein [Mannheimia varigena USDA-ARS-USMARC-1388]|uniref:mechanosensitive channel MscK n=1 Tax=Mannheimia varigena TaxID=85404 RepID=UPI0003E31E74|nr:mechanosensitive channel MscK [Mannheimia varigena]AHG79610.1 Potassium efflux system protein [Mannheimia varigena USDA-ARS-USMARC-1388]